LETIVHSRASKKPALSLFELFPAFSRFEKGEEERRAERK